MIACHEVISVLSCEILGKNKQPDLELQSALGIRCLQLLQARIWNCCWLDPAVPVVLRADCTSPFLVSDSSMRRFQYLRESWNKFLMDTERQLCIFHENCSRSLKLLFRIMKVFLFSFPASPLWLLSWCLATFSAKKATDVKHIRWGI